MSKNHSVGPVTSQGMDSLATLQGNGASWPYADISEATSEKSSIDWSIYWRSVTKRKWSILAITLVLTVLAMIYAQSVQPVFRSTTTLLIESGKTKILSSIEDVYNGVSQDREYYQTQVEILRSRDVGLRTVIATKLWEHPEFDPRNPVRSVQGRIKDFFITPSQPQTWTTEMLAEATVGKFFSSVSIEPVRLSQLVKISFESTDKELAAKMADAVATSFIESDRDARQKLNVSVTEQLQNRLSALRDKLLQSEQELQKYREGTGLVSNSGSQGIASQQMSEVSQRLVVAQVRRAELESAYQQVAKNASSASAVINQPGVMEARNRVSLASLKLEELTRSYGEANSKVIEARSLLAESQRQLGAQTGAIVGSLRAELQAARDTEAALQGQLSASRTAVQGVNRQEFQLGVLEREVQTNKQLYELLLSRTKETGVSTNLQGAVARIVDSASPATAPLRPNKPQIVMLTLLLTLAASAAASIAIDKFNTTIQGSDEVEHRLRHQVLATLPEVRQPAGENIMRLFLDEPQSGHAEAIRAARTSMLLANLEVGHKLVLVTSAMNGEGKTTFCTNLAFAHAQTKRTLLIDCDFRNPQIGPLLGLPDSAKGISDMVVGGARMRECVHSIEGSSLFVMPRGTQPVSPEEFLLSVPFQAALKSLANRVDVVLIDSPSVSLNRDALIIAQHADDTIFVVKARDTAHLMARRGLERLHRAGANVVGIVLNNVDLKSSWPLRRRTEVTAYEDVEPFAETAPSQVA